MLFWFGFWLVSWGFGVFVGPLGVFCSFCLFVSLGGFFGGCGFLFVFLFLILVEVLVVALFGFQKNTNSDHSRVETLYNELQ